MVALLTISFILIGVSIVRAIGRRFFFAELKEKPPNLMPPKAVSLFEPDEKTLAAIDQAERCQKANEEQKKLLAWASQVSFEALPKMQIEIVDNQILWESALEILTDRAAQSKDINALVLFVIRNEKINVNQKLINKFQVYWENAPNFDKTRQFFLLAIRSQNADLFQSIFTKAEHFIKTNKLFDLSLGKLSELAISHFWLLSPNARMSGAGFWLKQKLADTRRDF